MHFLLYIETIFVSLLPKSNRTVNPEILVEECTGRKPHPVGSIQIPVCIQKQFFKYLQHIGKLMQIYENIGYTLGTGRYEKYLQWSPMQNRTSHTNMDVSFQRHCNKSGQMHKHEIKAYTIFRFLVSSQYFKFSFNYIFLTSEFGVINCRNQKMAVLLNVIAGTV